MGATVSNINIWEEVAGGSGVQGQFQVDDKFKANLGSTECYLKNK